MTEDQEYPPDLTATFVSLNWKNSLTVRRDTSSHKRKNGMQEKRTIPQKLGNKPCEGCTHINMPLKVKL